MQSIQFLNNETYKVGTTKCV